MTILANSDRTFKPSEAYNTREWTCKHWETAISNEKGFVATKVALKIFKEMQQELTEAIPSPLYLEYTKEHPLERRYHFNVELRQKFYQLMKGCLEERSIIDEWMKGLKAYDDMREAKLKVCTEAFDMADVAETIRKIDTEYLNKQVAKVAELVPVRLQQIVREFNDKLSNTEKKLDINSLWETKSDLPDPALKNRLIVKLYRAN